MVVRDTRPGLETLREAMLAFTAAERRLRARRQKRGESFDHTSLHALYALTTVNEMTAGDLARAAGLNSASGTALIDQLEERGLVERRRDVLDRRRCWISLTETGRAELSEKEARWRRWLAEVLGDLSDDELGTACAVIERLAAGYDTYDQSDAPPGVEQTRP